MKRKVKGLIFLIFGFYLSFVNTILSILLYPVMQPCIPTPSGTYCVPMDAQHYWQLWFTQYGWITIITVLGGLILIFIGSRYFVIIKKIDYSETIAR